MPYAEVQLPKWLSELELKSDMDTLEKELQQGCSSALHARER